MKRFASFSLDTANECICQGQVRCQLPPKAFAVLRYLVDNPGRIVTKQELLDAVWPDTFVQEAVLKVCILEVRKALGENSKEPKFIDTVHRRGYRFIAPVSDAGDSAIDVAVQTHTLPGREKDLACLNMDSDLTTNAFGQAAYFNLLFTGWDERDFAASAAALDTARSSRDRVAIALHASRHPFFLALCSRYREASRTAEEGVRTAVEIESLIDYSVSHFFDAWALLHLGEWGRMRRLLRSAVELANKNGHEWWVLLFSLLEAFLFLQTFQFDAARLSCVDYLHRARKLGHELSIQMSLVLLGMAELGAGDLKAAGARFEEISDWQSRQRILMDWIWKLPLQLGLTELYVAQGDLKRARSEAEVFQRITAATAERTWSGLAHWAAATISCAERDDERARREISKGLAIVEGHEAPLASWRLHALAAQLEHQEYHSAKARAVVSELAESLSSDDELRASFLASGSVSTLFAGPLSRAVTPNH